MSIIVNGPGNTEVEFPDGTSPDIIDKVMRSAIAPNQPNTAMDILKSIPGGLVKGVTGLVGLPGAAKDAIDAGLDWGIKNRYLPAPSGTPAQRAQALGGMPDLIPRAESMNRGVQNITGEFHKPETIPGQYAETLAEFAPNMLSPGTAARRLVAGVVAPAVSSETAGQLTKGGQYETVARIAAALAGGMGASAAIAARNRSAAHIPGMSAESSRVLEKSLPPGAEARAADLGADAMLIDTTPAMLGVGQGIVTRPGRGQAAIVDALKGRQAGANARLTGELDEALGPAMSPKRLEDALEAQRVSLGPDYEKLKELNNLVDLTSVYDRLRVVIPQEAGATQRALREVMEMVAPKVGADRIPRSSPREVLNVRHALDDLYKKLGETPRAQGAVGEYRKLVDKALAADTAVPDVKVLDNTFSQLSKESEALRRGTHVLKTGPEGIRPEDLIADRAAMSLPEREAMRHGARAEIDRLVGTKVNDITALRQLVQSEGDWNRVKLAEIFGSKEAERIFKATDREAAFQDAYRKIVENSQTAQRQGAAKMLGEESTAAPSMRDMTVLGALAAGGQKIAGGVRSARSAVRSESVRNELAEALIRHGAERDSLMRQIRTAQDKRQIGKQTARELLTRALLTGNAATSD